MYDILFFDDVVCFSCEIWIALEADTVNVLRLDRTKADKISIHISLLLYVLFNVSYITGVGEKEGRKGVAARCTVYVTVLTKV